MFVGTDYCPVGMADEAGCVYANPFKEIHIDWVNEDEVI